MLRSPDGKRKVLRPVRPNAGVQAAYQRKLDARVSAMNRDTLATIKLTWKAKQPATLALDRSAAAELNLAMERLIARWTANFDGLAQSIARRFATAAMGAADVSSRAALRQAGMTVKWKLTPAANDAYRAVIAENVGLIKSIPAQYLTQVKGDVMRSVAAGRDLGTLTDAIEKQYGVTRRRAALIARDQNNKATAVVVKTRMQEAGITHAIWMHSGGGDKPRPSHVKAGRERMVFELAKGAFIDGEWILPGQLINCRCVSRPVLEGF